MSKPLVTINFNELKFNLYEVLGLTNEASESRIKKSYKKLLIELHPDKNPDSNEDIFNHIIIANQVLGNAILRKDYSWAEKYGLSISPQNENILWNIFSKAFKLPRDPLGPRCP